MTKHFFTLVLLIVCSVLIISCGADRETEGERYEKISGKTMGTTYRITYGDSSDISVKPAVDSLLEAINAEVSTYIDSSTISLFNRSDSGVTMAAKVVPHFYNNWKLSREIHDTSSGYFDPTVMPLVNYWGFGYTPQKAVEKVDSQAVDSLLQFVGMNHIKSIPKAGKPFLSKSSPGVELDFGGIAKGYAVDVLALFIEKQGITDYLVDIGGEIRCRGTNPSGNRWNIGINTPDPEASARSVKTILDVSGGTVATSGNYRNYHEINGQLYGHTISPFSGFPELNKILSVTVHASTCARADALATAFMAMGEERSISLAKTLDGIEILLIVSEPDGTVRQATTPGFNRFLNQNQ